MCFGVNMLLNWINWTFGIKIRQFLSILTNIWQIRRAFSVTASLLKVVALLACHTDCQCYCDCV